MTDINEKINKIWDAVVSGSLDLAKNIIIAIIVFYIGKFAINFLLKVVKKVMLRRNVDETVSKFILNILKISLQVTLFIAIIGILGVKTSSIMGLIAATGFGVGMALSGTMQNFANGILLLVFHPYKVGDFIEVNDISGTVKAIQIFHTILVTTDNKVIYTKRHYGYCHYDKLQPTGNEAYRLGDRYRLRRRFRPCESRHRQHKSLRTEYTERACSCGRAQRTLCLIGKSTPKMLGSNRKLLDSVLLCK